MAEWNRSPGFDLAGKKALVIGFTNPAGHAVAVALAEAGADVAAASATMDGDEVMAAKRASKAVAGLGRNTLSHGWDVTLPTNVQVSFKQVQRDFGIPDIVVYNGDTQLTKQITEVSDSEFGRVQAVNQNGAFYTTRTFLKERTAGTSGRLIYITSIFGERGVTGMGAYATAKAGVAGLMSVVSQEAGGDGVTANCISTGWMDWTPGRGPDEVGQNLLLRFIPQRQFGKGEDLGALAVLLASDAACFINGQVLHVDGGIMTHL
jgi:NAD(P)-dependent dehydrogenase (short-subunit alcohol dehydrogenase family)